MTRADFLGLMLRLLALLAIAQGASMLVAREEATTTRLVIENETLRAELATWGYTDTELDTLTR